MGPVFPHLKREVNILALPYIIGAYEIKRDNRRKILWTNEIAESMKRGFFCCLSLGSPLVLSVVESWARGLGWQWQLYLLWGLYIFSRLVGNWLHQGWSETFHDVFHLLLEKRHVCLSGRVAHLTAQNDWAFLWRVTLQLSCTFLITQMCTENVALKFPNVQLISPHLNLASL